ELAEINSDKATLTINAESAGAIEILVEEGETVEVGQVIAKIDTEKAGEASAPAKESAPAEEKTVSEPAAQPVAQNGGYAQGVPSVSADKMMKEKGINPAEVAGSGRGGRVTKADVVSFKPAEKPAAKKERRSTEKGKPPHSGNANSRRQW
ncbi:MAG: E3 binding domain-containing protein, partial [Bacteroidota bacterium]